MRYAIALWAVVVACTPPDAPPPAAAVPPSRVNNPDYRAEQAAAPVPVAPEAESSDRVPPEARAFWRKFRSAAIARDVKTLSRLTKFPFVTRGELDDDPKVEHTREEFAAVFAELLDQIERSRPGVSISMRELVASTPELRPEHFGEQEHFSVGAFFFGREAGQWKLAEAYKAGQ